MKYRMNQALVGLAAAFCLVGPSHADASDDPLPESQVKAARAAIDAQLKAERKKCRALEGERKDDCVLKADGDAKVARARLEARREATPETEQALKEAEAQVAYAQARAACRQPADAARKACVARARDQREAAVRQAKVEKVLALRAQQRESADPRPELSDKEKFAAAKARCDMSGAERDRCLAEAKKRFNRT